jgi:hypothetical protein
MTTTTSILITLAVAAIRSLILAYVNKIKEKMYRRISEAPEDEGTTSPTKPTKGINYESKK